MMKHEKFAAFILTHGRANNVLTVKALREAGYTGPVVVLIDDEDDQRQIYQETFGEMVYVFNKAAAIKNTDKGINSAEYRAVVFARNVCFDVAQELGYTHFIELDDDYQKFQFMCDRDGKFRHVQMRNLDAVLDLLIDFLERSQASAVAMAQGGDFIGGEGNKFVRDPSLIRKCMNTFVCATARPFKFAGLVNEDVTAYVSLGSRGNLFGMTALAAVQQTQTQKAAGGLTDIYLDGGTYQKSFYSILYSPSCVKIGTMGGSHRRLHHSIDWATAVPKIVREDLKKII